MVKIRAILVIMLMLTCAAQAYTIDAGDDLVVTIGEALAGIQLDATMSDPNIGEVITYLWTTENKAIGDPNAVFTEEDDLSPFVTFDFGGFGVYILKLTATGNVGGIKSDTLSIAVTMEKAMVAHFAIDKGELDSGTGLGKGFLDSSREGHPGNHLWEWAQMPSGWDEEKGVVGCDDGGSVYGDDDNAFVAALIGDDWDGSKPHADDLRMGMTLAVWYKGEDDKSHMVVKKEDTFAMRISRNGSDIQSMFKIKTETGTSGWITTRGRSNDLGDDIENASLNIRGNNGDGDDNSWHHLAMSYNALDGVVKIYVDGVKIVDDNDEFEPGDLLAEYNDPFATKYLSLGGDLFENDLDMRRGGLDDVRIYNYALEEHAVAELAAMGESVAMIDAGSSMVNNLTFDPNGKPEWEYNGVDAVDLPAQLDGAYIKLGRGEARVNDGGNDDYRVKWEKRSGPGDVIFTNSSDPTTYVTFTQVGIYNLRMYSYTRFCGDRSEHYDSMNIEVYDSTGVFDLDPCLELAGDLDGDCEVDGDDLKTMAENWLDVSY